MKANRKLQYGMVVGGLLLGGAACGQDFFPVGVWGFAEDYSETTYLSGGQYYLEGDERDKLLDLGVNYIIAVMDRREEQAMINFADSLQGVGQAFQVTLAWAFDPDPWDPYEVWPYSYQGAGFGDPTWEDRVETGYDDMFSHYGFSAGLHSLLVGAQHEINQQNRWNEVDSPAWRR